MKTEYKARYTKAKDKKIFCVRIFISVIILLTAFYLRVYVSEIKTTDYVSAFSVIGNGLSGDIEFREALEDAYIHAFGITDGNEKIKG